MVSSTSTKGQNKLVSINGKGRITLTSRKKRKISMMT